MSRLPRSLAPAPLLRPSGVLFVARRTARVPWGSVLSIAFALTLALSSVASAQAPTFLTSWGSYGTGPGQFDTPQGVAVGGSGDVYVVDPSLNRVQVFTSSGAFLRMWPLPGDLTTTGAFSIAVDASDIVYVGASYADLVYKYDRNGTPLGQWGSSGSGPGQFAGVFTLSIGPAGNVWAAAGGSQIDVFSPNGTLLRAFPFVMFQNTQSVAVDAQNNFYVADDGGHQVVGCGYNYTVIASWGSYGAGPGQFGLYGPTRLALDALDRVYVIDNETCRIEMFDRMGAFLAQWGSCGSAPGQFADPMSIAIDAEGNVYVADSSNSRIEKFGPVSTPAQTTSWGRLKVDYR